MVDEADSVNVDARFLEVSNVLASYSMRDFSAKANMSPAYDGLDTIISGINMLGEELQERTICREFMTDVFRAVKEMLFTINGEGKITDHNLACEHRLGTAHGSLIGKRISECFITEGADQRALDRVKGVLLEADDHEVKATYEGRYTSPDSQLRYVECDVTPFLDSSNALKGFLALARDITEKKNANKVFMRAMVQAVEKERSRFADDLHDSIGQELSSLKMLLSHILSKAVECKAVEYSDMSMILDLIDSTVRSLRDTCYNLMPSSLLTKGLRTAMIELKNRLNGDFELEFAMDPNIDHLPKDLQVDLFRITQEFISNSARHAEAENIRMFLSEEGGAFHLRLEDDGKGFDPVMVERRGRGLYTMQSRVDNINGDLEFRSTPGQGTRLDIYFNTSSYEDYETPYSG